MISKNQNNMPLSDVNRELYFLSEEYRDFGGGKIYDKEGRIIGKIDNKLFSADKRVEIQEIDKNPIAIIRRKVLSFHRTQEIIDSEGNPIAIIKRKKKALSQPKFYLSEPNGNTRFIASGNFKQKNYQIFNALNGKVVTKVCKTQQNLLDSLPTPSPLKDTFTLEIIDFSEEKSIIIGLVLAIENILNSQFFLADLGGYGRLTMRMRPFGPGIKEEGDKI